MSKTVDELMEAFRTGFRQRMQGPGIRPEGDIAIRAGIAAVVRELMEHFVTGASTYAWDADDLHAEFMKILGDAGAEKVAGGSTREDEKAVEAAGDKGPVTVNSPATDPAPAVCVWNTVAQGWEYDIVARSCTGSEFIVARSCTGSEFRVYGSGEHTCPSCKAPIKFTEAK